MIRLAALAAFAVLVDAKPCPPGTHLHCKSPGKCGCMLCDPGTYSFPGRRYFFAVHADALLRARRGRHQRSNAAKIIEDGLRLAELCRRRYQDQYDQASCIYCPQGRANPGSTGWNEEDYDSLDDCEICPAASYARRSGNQALGQAGLEPVGFCGVLRGGGDASHPTPQESSLTNFRLSEVSVAQVRALARRDRVRGVPAGPLQRRRGDVRVVPRQHRRLCDLPGRRVLFAACIFCR